MSEKLCFMGVASSVIRFVWMADFLLKSSECHRYNRSTIPWESSVCIDLIRLQLNVEPPLSLPLNK
jgi:hypothetical protein